MNKFVTIFFIHAVLCLSTNCLSQAKTSNESLSPEFTGQKYFESSGLYYFNNRYYDPALGRFLTPDPLQQYASPYSYADGDPLGRVDPSGLIFERLAELASSAFRALTSCCRGGVTEELGESLELRSIRSHNDTSAAAQGAVGGRISVSPETIQDISRAISESSSLYSIPIGVEEESIQAAFDLYYSGIPQKMWRVFIERH